MTNPPTSPTYNIISPREPICDKHGIITPAWWRFFQSTFVALGGYQPGPGGGTQPVNLTTLYDLAFSEFSDTQTDYSRPIADLQTELASRPGDCGEIADLKRRVQQLEVLVANLTGQDGLDLVQLGRDTKLALVLTLGGPQ